MSAVALKHCEKYPMHVYEVRPRKDPLGVDLISDALPFSPLWYGVDLPQTAVMIAIADEQHKMRS